MCGKTIEGVKMVGVTVVNEVARLGFIEKGMFEQRSEVRGGSIWRKNAPSRGTVNGCMWRI